MNKKVDRRQLQGKYGFLKPTNLQEGLMAFGFECGEGWDLLLEDLFEKIDKIVKREKIENFRVVQVKEKYGSLRVYCDYSNKEIEELIDKAEEESYKTCEMCGSKDGVTQSKGWISSLCKKCIKLRNKGK